MAQFILSSTNDGASSGDSATGNDKDQGNHENINNADDDDIFTDSLGPFPPPKPRARQSYGSFASIGYPLTVSIQHSLRTNS